MTALQRSRSEEQRQEHPTPLQRTGSLKHLWDRISSASSPDLPTLKAEGEQAPCSPPPAPSRPLKRAHTLRNFWRKSLSSSPSSSSTTSPTSLPSQAHKLEQSQCGALVAKWASLLCQVHQLEQRRIHHVRLDRRTRVCFACFHNSFYGRRMSFQDLPSNDHLCDKTPSHVEPLYTRTPIFIEDDEVAFD